MIPIKKTIILALAGVSLLYGCVSKPADNLELQKHFSERNVVGSFLLYEKDKDNYVRFCEDRCEKRYIPASTFKLLNAQIALETGVVEDENEIIQWDGREWAISSWNRDHSLRTAMENSVVWFYQEMAHRIGHDRMQEYVDLVGYGNGDISGSTDAFWLEGNLRISQEEQIEFLRKLYHEELPFSVDTMRTVKEIIVLEDVEEYRLSGKTGWSTSVNPDVGWFVGYVEKAGNIYYFATNVNLEGSQISLGKLSQDITMEILAELEILN